MSLLGTLISDLAETNLDAFLRRLENAGVMWRNLRDDSIRFTSFAVERHEFERWLSDARRGEPSRHSPRTEGPDEDPHVIEVRELRWKLSNAERAAEHYRSQYQEMAETVHAYLHGSHTRRETHDQSSEKHL